MTDGRNPARVADWIEHRRTDDGELLGFLVPDGDRFVAVTVFGYPLAEPGERLQAEDVLNTCGLSYLADRWHFRVDGQTRTEVEIVEASPERVVVKSVDFGSGIDYGRRFSVAAPVDGQLTRG